MPKKEKPGRPLEGLRKIRRALELTQADLGQDVDLSRWRISRLERGIFQIREQEALRIAEHLNLPLELLF